MGDSFDISSDSHDNFSFESTDKFTKYIAVKPTIAGVSKDNLYSVVTFKHNYNVTSTTTTIDENGDVFINVVLDYSPKN